MKAGVIALAAMIGALAATGAAAQGLSGRYRCVQNCRGPGEAYVTQSGWDLNLANEVGQPSRAWIDWPGHIWAEDWRQGAIVSPDGLTIQFDSGAVWERDFGAAPSPPPPPRKRKKHA